MIIVDTREQKWDHIRDDFERFDIRYMVRKLDFGDYMVPGGSVSVDRKHSLDELASNLCTRDRRRFWNEIRNAKRQGIRLVILIEHSRNYTKPLDVLKWKSRYSKITGQQLFTAMASAANAYGVEFRFCDRNHTALKIVEILEEEKHA